MTKKAANATATKTAAKTKTATKGATKTATKARKKVTKGSGTTAKKTTKKVPAAKEAPAKKTATPKVEGLRKPQVKLLQALKDASNPLIRKDWAEKAGVDNAACTEYVGSVKDEVREANDEKHFPSLVSLGYVRMEKVDEDGKNVIRYSITANGKKMV